MKIIIELDNHELTDELVRALNFSAAAAPVSAAAPKNTTAEATKAVSVSSPSVPAAQTTVPVQPEPSSDMRWHWCENAKCSEPIQIDHKVYINTQACPKCGTSTLHEANINSKKGAADERLAFLNWQRGQTAPVKKSEPEKYIICEVAEAPKKVPTAAPAQQIVPVAAPVQQTVPTVSTVPVAAEKQFTKSEVITAASGLVATKPECRADLRDLLNRFGIKSLQDLPADLVNDIAYNLRAMGAAI